MAEVITIKRLTAASLVAFTVFSAGIIYTFDSVARSTQEATTVQTVAPTEPVAEAIEPTVEVVETPEAETSPIVIETPAEDVPPTEPTVSPFTAEMTAAGLSEADQPIVRVLTLNGSAWNLEHCGCRISTLATAYNPVGRFQLINFYRASHYATWADALAQFEATGRW